jgi:hypothetical protein
MPAGMFSTPPALHSRNMPVTGPGLDSRAPASRGAAYGAAPPSRGGTWGAAAAAVAGGAGLPAGGPWDELRITQKLMRCIGPELSASELQYGTVQYSTVLYSTVVGWEGPRLP